MFGDFDKYLAVAVGNLLICLIIASNLVGANVFVLSSFIDLVLFSSVIVFGLMFLVNVLFKFKDFFKVGIVGALSSVVYNVLVLGFLGNDFASVVAVVFSFGGVFTIVLNALFAVAVLYLLSYKFDLW